MKGRQQAARGVLPAHQGFKTNNLARVQAQLRLVVQAQLARCDGIAQFGNGLRVRGPEISKPGDKVAYAAIARFLGLPQRHFSAGHQIIDVPGIGRKNGSASRQAEFHRAGLCDQIHFEVADQALGSLPQVLGVSAARQHQREFITTQTCQQVLPAGGFPHAVSHGEKHLVGHGMAHGVIDGAQVVHVDPHHQHKITVGTGAAQELMQVLQKLRPVGQQGQLIKAGDVLNLVSSVLEVADVVQEDTPACGAGTRVLDRNQLKVAPKLGSIHALDHGLHTPTAAIGKAILQGGIGYGGQILGKQRYTVLADQLGWRAGAQGLRQRVDKFDHTQGVYHDQTDGGPLHQHMQQLAFIHELLNSGGVGYLSGSCRT